MRFKILTPMFPVILIILSSFAYFIYSIHREYISHNQQSIDAVTSSLHDFVFHSQKDNSDLINLLLSKWSVIDSVATHNLDSLINEVQPYADILDYDLVNIYDPSGELLVRADNPAYFGIKDELFSYVKEVLKNSTIIRLVIIYEEKILLVSASRIESNYGSIGVLAVGRYFESSDLKKLYSTNDTTLELLLNNKTIIRSDNNKNVLTDGWMQFEINFTSEYIGYSNFTAKALQNVSANRNKYWSSLLSLSIIFILGGMVFFFISRKLVTLNNQLEITRRETAEKNLHASEQDLAITLNSIGDAVISTDVLGNVVRMNPVAEKLTGWSLDEARGLPLKAIFPIVDASTREPIENPIDKVLSSGKTVYLSNHTTLIAKDGSEYQIADSAAPIRDKGKILGMVLVFNDVTEQYHLREAAKKTSRDMQAILDYSPALIFVKDIEGRYLIINQQYEKIFNVQRGDVVGKTDYEVFPKEFADSFIENDKQVRVAGHALESEEVAPLNDGSHTFHSTKFPLFDESGNIYATCGISIDITERKQMEEELFSSAQHLKLYRDQAPLATIEWNPDFEIINWNNAAEKMFGYKLDEVKGRYFIDFMLPENAVVDIKQLWNDLISQKGGTQSINENLTKDGRIILCEWHNTPLKDDSGNVIGAASIVMDITERRQAEERWKFALEGADNGLWDWDIENNKVFFSTRWKEMLGYDEAEITDSLEEWEKRLHPGDKEGSQIALEQHLSGKLPYYRYEYRFLCKDGSYKWISTRGKVIAWGKDHNPLRMIGTHQDISERKQQDEQIRRSQKMDALGKLTGGIAHDYNNMLGIIMGYSELLNIKLQNTPELAKYSQEIYLASERGADLTKKLLGFSRPVTSERTVFNINQQLLELQHMLEKTLTARINLILNLDKNLWNVRLDIGELENVIVNLCINSMHAIEGNGKLTIQTLNTSVNAFDAQLLGLNSSDYVLLTIIDTGCGMDEITKEKIFEPFFSTKGEKGTGLGLSQVYGFVKNSGGAIKVYSEKGKGSKFSIYFPSVDCVAEDKKSPEVNESISTQSTGTILVVDDEPALVNLVAEILGQQGYQVLCAESAKQALIMLDTEPVDILLSDVIMPEMDGYQLANIVQRKYPNIKIQLSSGFSDNRHADMVEDSLHKSLISKPYNSKVLLERIRELLV